LFVECVLCGGGDGCLVDYLVIVVVVVVGSHHLRHT
jgi:hypothetical protein